MNTKNADVERRESAYPRLRRLADWCTSNSRWNPLPYWFFFGGPVLMAPFFLEFTWSELAAWAAMHYAMAIGVNISHHRYFSHHSYATSRPMQFLIGLWGCLTLQRGPLWWASTHRIHHRYCETPDDPHTPSKGFYHAHFGWTMDSRYRGVQWSYVKDLARYPELYWLELAQIVMLPLFTGLAYMAAGMRGVVLYHVALTTAITAEAFVNSLCHAKEASDCQALDRAWVALLNGGDGYHKHHHERPRSARHATGRRQLDVTYGVICVLERLGLVWKVAHPPKR